MRLLLDTQLIIWASSRSRWISRGATAAIEEAETVSFSVVSIWETAIEWGKRLPDFDAEPGRLRDGLLANGYAEVSVTGLHALAVTALPPIHGDPFDRLLMAQATVEGLTFLTADRALVAYGPPVRLV